jgi:hypothetical protein
MAGDLCGLENGESHKLAVEAVDIAEMAIFAPPNLPTLDEGNRRSVV